MHYWDTRVDFVWQARCRAATAAEEPASGAGGQLAAAGASSGSSSGRYWGAEDEEMMQIERSARPLHQTLYSVYIRNPRSLTPL